MSCLEEERGKYTYVKYSDSGYCSNWKSKNCMMCFSVLSCSNKHTSPCFVVVLVIIKVHIVGKIEKAPVHQIPEAKVILRQTKPPKQQNCIAV